MIPATHTARAPQRPQIGRILVAYNFPLRFDGDPASDDLVERITTIAVRHFLAVLAVSADHVAPYKTQMTIDVDGKQKVLLLVGTAHGAVEDGSAIAVLNPAQDLVDKLHGGWGCNSAIFREVVAKKCDVALNLWIDAYKTDGVCVGTQYVAQEHKPARCSVR